MDSLPFVKWIAASSAFGSGMLFFAWMWWRERQLSKGIRDRHDNDSKEVTQLLMALTEKQTEALTRNTEALVALRTVNERVLFDVTRSFTPPVGVQVPVAKRVKK